MGYRVTRVTAHYKGCIFLKSEYSQYIGEFLSTSLWVTGLQGLQHITRVASTVLFSLHSSTISTFYYKTEVSNLLAIFCGFTAETGLCVRPGRKPGRYSRDSRDLALTMHEAN